MRRESSELETKMLDSFLAFEKTFSSVLGGKQQKKHQSIHGRATRRKSYAKSLTLFLTYTEEFIMKPWRGSRLRSIQIRCPLTGEKER